MEQYKDRADVQFISFNADANPGIVQPFLKEHKLSCVVIPAYDYVQALTLSVPSTWIVDGNGVVRLKGQGYDPTEKWEIGMKDAIEKVSRVGGAAATSGASP